ncbi:hypothetical protein DUZ99_05435 [Xylanibacillus composti]|uniref:Uncharacterized protein n=1 Tax=Xylanibacillus composti TaxID=1572762 RepID=A0A8J4H1T6_9BACL|nr:hypothetical protein [Xylanibacillus composti]MDT9724430.1 hypothetical protein [Xylanibacillus composti]GIQ68026.1 hypothetical protein XYCOK13_08500 [Xylanibacillus composti]
MLDFLFSNPLFIFIVIGLISMLFRQRKEAAPTRQRRPGQQGPVIPTFGNEEPQQARGFGKHEPAARQEEPDYMAALEAFEQADATRSRKPEPKPMHPFPRVAVLPKEEKRGQKSNHRQPTAEEARLGMMWAEVFGPPRAKRPYR